MGLAYGLKRVGAAGRPAADSAAHALAGAAARLAAFVAVPWGGRAGHGLSDPRDALGPMVWCALAVVLSATQDTVPDAYRIESADATHQAALAASYQTGYRLAA